MKPTGKREERKIRWCAVCPKQPFPLKKRQLMVLSLVMVLAAVGVKTGRIVTAFDADDFDTLLHGAQVSGHRGNSSDAPENSRAALEKPLSLVRIMWKSMWLKPRMGCWSCLMTIT